MEDLALHPLGLGAVALEAPGGPVNAAAAGGGEGNHPLAGQGMALQEGVHDAGLHIPPDGKAQEHGVVLVHVFHRGGDGRTAGGVVHLDGAAALFVGPVQVGSGVGDGGADLIQVAPTAWAMALAARAVVPLAEK